MFVKVLINNDDKSKRSHLVYDCDRAFIQPTKKSDKIEVVLEGMSDGTTKLILSKATSVIYLMNKDGQTIDTHRWP